MTDYKSVLLTGQVGNLSYEGTAKTSILFVFTALRKWFSGILADILAMVS
jgi:hypothetical protein